MKVALEADLENFVVAEQQKVDADRANREKRWAAILHRQQQSLLQHEQALKTEEKELQRLQREKQWKKSQALVETNTEASSCAGRMSHVRAFISAPDTHASCLKSQLGACVSTETTAAPSLKC